MKTATKAQKSQTYTQHNPSLQWSYSITVNEDAAVTYVKRYMANGHLNTHDGDYSMIGFIYSPEAGISMESIYDEAATTAFYTIYSGRPMTEAGEKVFKREIKARIKEMNSRTDYYNYIDIINEMNSLL